MGVAERKERHKEELKREILLAAKALFLEQGYHSTSIRNIAEKIEYSPATVYLYYKDKDEIMHALHQEGFKMLLGYFGTLASIQDPFERLVQMGYAYIKFALENPEVYNLIFVMEEPMHHVANCKELDWDEGKGAFETLRQNVIDCQQQGHFSGLEPGGLSLMIWSTMHGLCTLRSSGHLAHVSAACDIPEEVNTTMKHTYELFISILKHLK